MAECERMAARDSQTIDPDRDLCPRMAAPYDVWFAPARKQLLIACTSDSLTS